MTIRRPFVVLARNILLLALLGCLAACQMPFGMGQRAPEPKPQPVAPAPATGPCVVLALPSSGTYAAIAGKVRHGAQMAQNELAANGVKLRLETINTEAPDWLQRLDALPQACSVVGGPLQARNYAQAREHGQLEKRAFFTFVPSLEQGDEGARAWRFFPSPQDQIDTLIGFATTGMNIRTYGAFYPTDAYGVRMTGLMEQSLASQNMLLQKASYNPADPTSWSDAVAPLINAQTPQGSKTPVPQTSFEGLFLPDSWKSMEMLTTSLLYNGEDRLVLLGTTLWEQSLSGKTISNADKYALAVFPAAWNQPQAPRALQVPGTDFWNALGYDFVRFAVSMGLDSRLTTPQVTARAQRASKMIWGMAPISWDNAGVAHQKLFLFGVSPTGMTPVNIETFQQTRARVLQQSALRMQGLPPVDATGAPVAAPAAGAEAAPAVQQGQTPPSAPIMSNTPRPSYKLSLPTAR
ncbi:hypothetical protein DDIC_11460 [Desulfovibrio desulfuricans]|uniref:Leucine-binding protein domain-containing protein n=1 Tax=Desulfovibrio desulfuricans TaxID=876 RepID=A0A4P7UJY0_DESDE|nr:hypothetical protein [Desulfovibrio desulfuricans]QCC86479.1 hypothetical protein DDIC_11460 [Desulfovibrio desulfuricans]